MDPAAQAPLSLSDDSGGWLSVLAAFGLPLVVAVVLVPFRHDIANTAAALLLVMVVVGVAAFGDRRAGWIAAASSGIWFDYFLTRPYERFSILATRDVETTIALFVVGLAVTEIAVRSRRHFAVAWAEGNYLALIHDLSDLVATGGSRDAVLAAAREDLIELLGLRECRFEETEATAVRAQLRRNGEVELGDERFDVGNNGLPAGAIELVVQSQGHVYGSFVMEAGEHRGVSIEQRIVALLLADQVGAAMGQIPSGR
jgi:K+-sensing histidine kinase KdpD